MHLMDLYPIIVTGQGAGLAIAYPLHDETWGQRRFAVYDPSGTWVDVIQQIEPEPGFWDKYLVPVGR